MQQPRKLLLIWKDSDNQRHTIGALTQEKFWYTFDKDEMRECKNFTGYPAFPIDRVEHTNHLSIMYSRCPAPYRSDFPDHLRRYGINPQAEQTRKMIFGLYDKKPDAIMQLLGYTGALVPFDPFCLDYTFEDAHPPFEFVLIVAGYHYALKENRALATIDKGDPVTVEHDPHNSKDPHALKFMVEMKGAPLLLGYVPRDFQNSFSAWRQHGRSIGLSVYHVNRHPQHPYAYLFAQVS